MNLFSNNKILGIIGGGQLGKMLLNDTFKWNITTYVLDPDKDAPAKQFCNKFYCGDLNDFDVKGYTVIVCTACEHITDDEINSVLLKKDKSTIVFLQSNNYNEVKDHINCKKSVNDFANSLQLNSYKKYTLSLDKYERFMVIGK